MTTAIIGVGNIGSAVARHLVGGSETVVVAAQDGSHAEALADLHQYGLNGELLDLDQARAILYAKEVLA